MPWGSSLFPLLIITAGGGFTGLFEYSPAPGTGNLILSSTAANGTDPFGNAFFQGLATYVPSLGHSFVVNLLSTAPATAGLFQYNNPSGGLQGALILAVSAAGGVDPVDGTTFPAGLYGVDPVFGDTLQTVGASINFGQTSYTQTGNVQARTGAGATSPALELFAPEQGVTGHIVVVFQGTSPDGTHLGQFLIGREPTGGTVPTPVTSAMIEFQSPTTALADSLLQLLAASGGATTDNMIGMRISGDANNRLRINADGTHIWRFGAVGTTFSLTPFSNTQLNLTSADLDIATAGHGLLIAEGANARQGRVTLAAGTSGAIANTTITANTHIYLSRETIGAGAIGDLSSTRVVGTSFTINSNAGTDVSTISWLLTEPG